MAKKKSAISAGNTNLPRWFQEGTKPLQDGWSSKRFLLAMTQRYYSSSTFKEYKTKTCFNLT